MERGWGEGASIPTRLLRTSLLFIGFQKHEWAKQKFNAWFCFYTKLKLQLKLKLNQKNYKTKNFNLVKLETALARVNLHGLNDSCVNKLVQLCKQKTWSRDKKGKFPKAYSFIFQMITLDKIIIKLLFHCFALLIQNFRRSQLKQWKIL